MNAEPKKPQDDQDLDEALSGTFPASDPVAPASHIEDEMERRRQVLEDDARKKREEQRRSPTTHSEDLLDEGLDETFPASDPVAVHGEDRRRAPETHPEKTPRKPSARR